MVSSVRCLFSSVVVICSLSSIVTQAGWFFVPSNSHHRDQYNRHPEGSVFRVLSSIGYRQCLEECGRRKHCLSINYSWKHLVCGLSRANATADDVPIDGDFISLTLTLNDFKSLKACALRPCSENYTCIDTISGGYRCLITECTNPRDGYPNTFVGEISFEVGVIVTLRCDTRHHTGKQNPKIMACGKDGKWTTIQNGVLRCD